MAEAFPKNMSSDASGTSDSPSTSSRSGQNSSLEDSMRSAMDFMDESQGSPGPVILDYSYSGMETSDLAEALANQPLKVFRSVETILATHNNIFHIPEVISRYTNLRHFDMSSNQLTDISDSVTLCGNLTTLIVRNNHLDEHSFPKSLKNLTKLTDLNISGNSLTRLPYEILETTSLHCLQLGANRIDHVTKDLSLLTKLEVLYLGGNSIGELPAEIGELKNLKVFVLCENQLEFLPKSISNLKQLRSLQLHKNRITALPVELIKLRNLMELSLRDNPLVNKFVRDMVYDPPSLMELAGRTIKLKKIPFKNSDLPKNLIDYLTCAHQCVNPRCKGVFFDTRVEHIKFVDFCGKYRVPLLEYLCSPKCSDLRFPAYEVSSDSEPEDQDRIRKVLLG